MSITLCIALSITLSMALWYYGIALSITLSMALWYYALHYLLHYLLHYGTVPLELWHCIINWTVYCTIYWTKHCVQIFATKCSKQCITPNRLNALSKIIKVFNLNCLFKTLLTVRCLRRALILIALSNYLYV